MENPTRTAQYLELMAKRRRDLRACHAQILAPHTRFTWEIGSGHGHFLAAYAQAHPSELCVGIDIIGERVERAQRKRDRASLANLHFVHAEARLFLETLPEDATFSRLFILFPDPWPKLRHHKHRIMQPDFLASVAARAGEGARLYFRTDFTPYYDDTKAALSGHANWDVIPEGAEPWPFEHETVFQARAPSYHSLIARPKQPATTHTPPLTPAQ